MSSTIVTIPEVDLEGLRCAIREEYAEVARRPEKGFHFHTGRSLAERLEYDSSWIDAVPATAVESFAGTGNPFRSVQIKQGDRVVDVGSGAGMDSLIAGGLVGPGGHVIGVDMTGEMLEKARDAALRSGIGHVEFREACAEALPVADGWADVVISNGVVNLCPDKLAVLREMYRVLKTGGRLSVGDILVQKPVSEKTRTRIDLWTG
ncbi:MAG: methyltransferase domain-containing protein [Acidobacteria bacterium]|nr:methyltransferase domain-containing protein [Acidobacteriota bacterium]